MRRTLLPLVCSFLGLLACPTRDDSESGASTASDGSGTSSATAGTRGDVETTTASGDTTAMGSSGVADDGTTARPTTPLDACTDTCEHLVECDLTEVPNCGIPCAGINATVPGCEDEYVAQQECVAALSCEDAQAWSDAMGVGSEHPCAAEDDALQTCMA